MQGDAAFPVPFRACDLLTPKPAAALDADSLGAHPQRAGNALLHGPAESDPALELQGDVLRHQLRVQIGPPHLVDVYEDFPGRELPQLFLELFDLGALLADDDPRTGRVDVDLRLVGGPFDLDLRNTRVMKPALEETLDLEVLVQQLGVVVSRVPLRVPRLDHAHAENLGVRFLSHGQALSSTTTVRWLRRLRIRLARPIPRGMNRFHIPA